jgi:hypothetical protein
MFLQQWLYCINTDDLLPDMFDENQDLNVIWYYLLWIYSEWTLFINCMLYSAKKETQHPTFFPNMTFLKVCVNETLTHDHVKIRFNSWPSTLWSTEDHFSSRRLLHPGTSLEKPHHDSKRNSIKCTRSPTNIGTDSQKPSPWKRLTRQKSLPWRSTETSASTCKGTMVQQSEELGPTKLEASLAQRWIKIHAA